MSYGYGGRANPFDDRGDGGGGRGGGGYGQPAMGRDEYGNGNVEMTSLTQNASSFGQGDPNAILNECADIDRGIGSVDQNLAQMKMLQQRALDDADSSAGSNTNRQIDALSSETMALYRSLTERVRLVKSNPESKQPKNAPQVGRVDRRLKQAIQAYQTVESQFRKKTQDQMARQYRIVRPDADESEVQAAVEDPSGGQVFQQALMQSNRRGQAQSVLSAVQDRHAQLEKIEQQIIELAQLFQDMDVLVVQQEESIQNIEQKAEETVENFDKGNEEIGTAINTARATRKKKWVCLGVVVGIIVVIVVIVVVYMLITKKSSNTTTNNKRWLEDANDVAPRMLAGRDSAEAEKRWIKLFRGQTAKVPRGDDPASQFLAERDAEVEKRWMAGNAWDEHDAVRRWVGSSAPPDVAKRALRLPGGRGALVG